MFMAAVLSLVPRINKDTIDALEYLLRAAKRGEIAGIALTYRNSSGDELAAFTGVYLSPGNAVNAAMRLSWKLTQAQDFVVGPP
jgi:hypothetical protein